MQKKMLIQAQLNLHQSEKIKELKKICSLDVMVISHICPFMFVVAKTKGAQNGLSSPRTSRSRKLENIQVGLSRSCNEECLITFSCEED